ncbi:MAG: RNA polymerase factor sigma-54 [Candidatus Omnitrophica bacterium]|nr:RNA polymerase factor sigma-54 [Candidatus Omnitrophota bacterium]
MERDWLKQEQAVVPGLHLRPSLFPQQQLYLRFLVLPVSALREYLQQQASENPVLEMSLSEEEGWAGILTDPPESVSFRDYLRDQLRMEALSPQILEAGEYLIENLEENGYLRLSLKELASGGYSLKNLSQALKAVQALEPAGVGARNLQENILLQIERKKGRETFAYKIVKNYWSDFCRQEFSEIIREFGLTAESLNSVLNEIMQTHPYPLSGYVRQQLPRRIMVDGLVEFNRGQLKVTLGEQFLPVLWVNPEYVKLVNEPTLLPKERAFLKTKIREAMDFITALDQWKLTLLKIFTEIAFFQRKYWQGGELLPLREQDVAQRTGYHLSTVSRAITGKYLSTPRGVIPVRRLFSRNVSGQVSQERVKALIQRILLTEAVPLSDREVAEKLAKAGISLAVRTVNKYRTKLKLPNSYFRFPEENHLTGEISV